MHQFIIDALSFAIKAHNGQKRKYTYEPYILHPVAVYGLGIYADLPPVALVACLLHDVVEDTKATTSDINHEFGGEVAKLVKELTDVYTSDIWKINRKSRKELERQRISEISFNAKSIKLADLIDNAKTIIVGDPEFAEVYMAEMKALLLVLCNGNAKLFELAETIVNNYYAGVKP